MGGHTPQSLRDSSPNLGEQGRGRFLGRVENGGRRSGLRAKQEKPRHRDGGGVRLERRCCVPITLYFRMFRESNSNILRYSIEE